KLCSEFFKNFPDGQKTVLLQLENRKNEDHILLETPAVVGYYLLRAFRSGEFVAHKTVFKYPTFRQSGAFLLVFCFVPFADPSIQKACFEGLPFGTACCNIYWRTIGIGTILYH